mgnify:FL=1
MQLRVHCDHTTQKHSDSSDDLHVGAVLPDLRGLLTVISPPQDVVARLHTFRDDHFVRDHPERPVAAACTLTRAVSRPRQREVSEQTMSLLILRAQRFEVCAGRIEHAASRFTVARCGATVLAGILAENTKASSAHGKQAYGFSAQKHSPVLW